MTDRPFALPNRGLITHVVDMPFPPSLNELWRFGRNSMYRSKQYIDWIAAADAMGIWLRAARGPRIEGPFAAEVVLDRNERGRAKDLDNYSFKAVLDRAAAWGLIANDKHQERITASWGIAQHGARLTLTELSI